MAEKNSIVLLIDDDPTFIDVYTRAFQANAIEFQTAFNGIEAIDKATSGNPSLILLDIMMPGLDGFEVLKRLKGDSKTKNIPVWMITNLAGEMNKETAKSLGAEDYLVKSDSTPNKVCDKINEFFSSRK